MTHDELLALLNWEVKHQYTRWVNALRAVVELHKPSEFHGLTNCDVCSGWDGYGESYGEPYPCPTIQAIEKELSL